MFSIKFSLQAAFWAVVCSACAMSCDLALGQNQVQFDVPSTLVAQSVDPSAVHYPQSSGRFIRIRVPVSLITQASFRGEIEECSVKFESPLQSLRVLDSWPKTELYSNVVGAVSVEETQQSSNQFEAKLSGGLEPFARASLGGEHRQQSTTKEHYQRQPSMQKVLASGTSNRGFGVFFKFRPGPTQDLQGVREFAFLAEVPTNWRADLMLVTVQATGRAPHSRGVKSLGHSKLWVALHQEGDLAAAAQARRFVTQERALRALAASRQEEIQRKATPTVFHQIGVALDMVEPRIPADYLQRVLFGPLNQYLEGDSHRLPVDLRVAILDFWDEREALADLAFGSHVALRPNT